ncbi:melanocyte-stimulating hormone receptor-like [Exaiptasia diaphana]|uniref:G-protein coupled receptors family 1 profile domain-containing protein n=1 Tax=Exaiptasia diaphana TaxID=2652724 RepID=A0A913YPC7_EXADI|nr:melanocyte-stimulating hormone receptor-like [Exaiptasia diaphana]
MYNLLCVVSTFNSMWVLSSIEVGLSVLAIVLNLLTILTFVKTPSLRTPSNILILSLAITDFGVGAVVEPAYCTQLFARLGKPLKMINPDFYASMVVINAFSGVLATVLNLLIILTFVKTPSLRTPSNILILSLAITDFGAGALLQPVYCTAFLAVMTKNIILKNTVEVFRPSSFILTNASLFTITAITVDRFLALHLHLRYQELVTTKRTVIVLIVLWTSSVLLCVFLLYLEAHFAMVIVSVVLLLSLLSINIGLMLRIASIIRQHAAHIQLQQQVMNALQPGEAVNIKRSVNVMYYILGAFFLCNFPFICVILMQTFNKKLHDFVTVNVARTILMMNSSINPVIYFWRIHDMRKVALQLLRSLRRKNREYMTCESVTEDD